MIGAWALLLCVAAVLFLATAGWRAYVWHHRGVGECQAHAAYARIRRDRPDIAEARLSETEFVRYYVASRAGIAPYVIALLLLMLLGLPASWALMAGWPWD
jgi:hypothetical protein